MYVYTIYIYVYIHVYICIHVYIYTYIHVYIYTYIHIYSVDVGFLTLRWGWVYLERTQIFSGIQFTKHLIEFIFVETNQSVCSNSNVTLTRQTCGQRSGMSAGSKCRALGNYLSDLILDDLMRI